MRTGEFFLAIHAKRVVPDHPTTTMKANFLCFDFQFCSVLVTNRQPERPVVFEDAMNLGHPVTGPAQVLVVTESVIVFVVFKTDIERGISERQVDNASGNFFQSFDTVTLMNFSTQVRDAFSRDRFGQLSLQDD
mgnify:CR=1 FL=1